DFVFPHPRLPSDGREHSTGAAAWTGRATGCLAFYIDRNAPGLGLSLTALQIAVRPEYFRGGAAWRSMVVLGPSVRAHSSANRPRWDFSPSPKPGSDFPITE